VTEAQAAEGHARARLGIDIDRRTVSSGAVAVGLILFALFGLPALFGSAYITEFTAVAIYSITALGFGLLYGRVGMISLGQVALLSIGVWTGTRLAYATSIPFPLLLIVVGAVVMAIGLLVGLTAIRLSGLYLALVTLMFAGATEVVLSVIDFPNGGGGFTGHTSSANLSGLAGVRKPSIAEGITSYYRYVVIVAAILFVLALLHVAGKPGRAWASIRESEPAAIAAGVNITFYKLWAFALASFVTGVAGCLLAALNGVSRAINFHTQDSLTLAASALIGGIFSVWGALIAGVFKELLPYLFQTEWGVDPNLLLVVFGAGLLQVLLSAPGGLIDQFPKDMANLGRLITGKVPVTRRVLLGIGSIIALILGIVFLATVTPIIGVLVVMSSPILAVYSLD
jgi:branched-chain amino acid transport system permease protein